VTSHNGSSPVLCPSAPAAMAGSVVLGVIREIDGRRFVHHIAEPPAVTSEILALAQGAPLAEVFRFAAPCQATRCRHFEGNECRLAAKLVVTLDNEAGALPDCAIRADCRWFRQEGTPACLRCPLIFSEIPHPSEALRLAADSTY
jgi:hypothetical protein